MPRVFLFTLALYFFMLSVLASYQDVLKDAPAPYFGFHFMIPLYYNNGIPSSVVKDLRSIFTDIRANPDAASFQIIQERYDEVINTLESKCRELCKRKNMDDPPHTFLIVDETFCDGLWSKMLNWFYYMSFNLPNPNVFFNVDLSRKSIDMPMLEHRLAEMANETIYKLEVLFDRNVSVTNLYLDSISRALQAMVDICRTFEHGRFKEEIVQALQIRLKHLLTLYLRFRFTPISGTSVVSGKPFQVSIPQMSTFLVCRFNQNLTITECARHLDIIGKSRLSMMELVNRIHVIQILYPASSRANQRFLAYLFKGIILEHHLYNPKSINDSFREHLLQKIPIPPANTSKQDYIQHWLASSKVQLPQIFAFYLIRNFPRFHDHFQSHYRSFDLYRLCNSTEFSPIVNLPPALDKFTEIYNRFNRIVQDKGLFFKSLLFEKESLQEAFDLFVEELSGYADHNSYELFACTTELVNFYRDQLILDTFCATDLLARMFTWFNPGYLKESLA